MFLSHAQLKTFKQVNVSKDAEKTKERIAQDFKAASNADKQAICELSGQVRSSIYRIYNTGSINARLLMAFAQVLNKNPFYYTGETDELEPLDIEHIRKILTDNNYDDLLAELIKNKRKVSRKPKGETKSKTPDEPPAVTTDDENGSMSDTSITAAEPLNDFNKITSPVVNDNVKEIINTKEVKLLFSDGPNIRKAVEELSEQETVELLRALFIRSKVGGEAELFVEVIKRCLLK